LVKNLLLKSVILILKNAIINIPEDQLLLNI
jgi:hypothetical protein